MTEETFSCERCERSWPQRQMKEVMYEQGKERMKMNVCPECLDEVMASSGGVRGISGEDKRAAIHISDAEEENRGSLGERG